MCLGVSHVSALLQQHLPPVRLAPTLPLLPPLRLLLLCATVCRPATCTTDRGADEEQNEHG